MAMSKTISMAVVTLSFWFRSFVRFLAIFTVILSEGLLCKYPSFRDEVLNSMTEKQSL